MTLSPSAILGFDNLTLGYTDDSRRAVRLFLDEAHEKGLIPSRVPVEFA